MHPRGHALPHCVNVVGTRCADGEHAALQRWYADHVHQLMAFDGLLGGTATDPAADPTALVWQGRYEPVLQGQR